MENTELLKFLNKELIDLKESNIKMLNENKGLKNNNDILNAILAQIPTKKLCYELVSRSNGDYIELEKNDKIFILTSKGMQELEGRGNILTFKI